MRLFRHALPLLVLLSACAPGRGLPPLPQADTSQYRLGAGDTVRIITFGEDSLTGEFRVGDSGMIALPLIGPVRAGGANTQDLEQRVAQALKRANLLRNPSVAVEVITYRPIYVLGEVTTASQRMRRAVSGGMSANSSFSSCTPRVAPIFAAASTARCTTAWR